MEGVMGLDRLRDHYKHCIRLSASNKINTKNAFDLQLIDYMQDLVSSTEDGQMNFKIASSALDVGAKIYSSRVDCIQSEAQKVASSILMALDGQKNENAKAGDEANDSNVDHNVTGDSEGLDDAGVGDDAARTKNTRKKTRRNVKTIVEDEATLDGKLEQMVLSDLFLDGLSQDYDMSCPAALICFNALTQPSCLLTIESNNLRKNYQEESSPSSAAKIQSNQVTLITKNLNCSQIIRNNQSNHICPRLQNFIFNDRTTTISGFNSNLDETVELPEPIKIDSSKLPTGGAHEFNPEQYDNDGGHDDYSDAGDCGAGIDGHDENDFLPNLDKIAASKPSEYGFSHEHHRLLNTWAGPYAWKVAKVPMTAKQEGCPKSARKRVKLEQLPIDWFEETPVINEEIVDKSIRHSAQVLRRWTKKPFRPQDHNFTEESTRIVIKQTFLKPEDTYHCMRTPADARKLVDDDHDYAQGRNHSDDCAPNSPGLGGFDDVHDDSDDEFRADPVVDGNEEAVYGTALNTSFNQQSDLEFAGENLIDQPFTFDQVFIPFAKIAKKMDIRKLKHVMWDLLQPETKPGNTTAITENNITVIENENTGGDQTTIVDPAKKTPSPTPSEVHLAFSHLYGGLPVRVSSKMANDLSQPIAFVTLLHLANEKNLKLLPNEDLKDFVIEQDELI